MVLVEVSMNRAQIVLILERDMPGWTLAKLQNLPTNGKGLIVVVKGRQKKIVTIVDGHIKQDT